MLNTRYVINLGSSELSIVGAFRTQRLYNARSALPSWVPALIAEVSLYRVTQFAIHAVAC